MSPLVEGLSNVDWGSVRDASGSAERIPSCIRQLRSSDATERLEALEELYGRLLHQASVNEATAVAVPFIAEVARDPATPDRHRVLLFLRTIVRLVPESSREGFSLTAAQRAVGRVDEQALRRCVAAIAPLEFLAGVEDADPLVRAATAALLGLTSPDEPIAARVRAVTAGETDPEARASQLLCLAVQSRRLGTHGDEPLFAGVFSASSHSSIVRVAAGLALVHVRGAGVPADVIEALVRAARETGQDGDFPWNGGDLLLLVAMALSEIGKEAPARVVPSLRALLVETSTEARRRATPRVPSPAEVMLAKVMGQPPPQPGPPEIDPPTSLRLLLLSSELLQTAFPRFEGRREDAVTLDELDGEQRAILKELAVDLDVEAPYGRYGLPGPQDVPAYLGLIPTS